MKKSGQLLAVVVMVTLVAGLVMGAIILSNMVEQETTVGETPLAIEIKEINLVGYPNPLGGEIVQDPRHFPNYVITGEMVDEELVITTIATVNATMYLAVETTETLPRAWMWDGISWQELEFVANQAVVIGATFEEGSPLHLPVILQFSAHGHYVLTWWCEG